jgi:hypothetical protein
LKCEFLGWEKALIGCHQANVINAIDDMMDNSRSLTVEFHAVAAYFDTAGQLGVGLSAI